MATANPYQRAARETKANAIATEILDSVKVAPPWFLDAIRNLDQPNRDKLARMAGQKSPSPETWDRVVDVIQRRLIRRAGRRSA
jgi:hypothetical protein